MNTNAERLQAWCDANPGSHITESILMDAAGLTTLWHANLWGAEIARRHPYLESAPAL